MSRFVRLLRGLNVSKGNRVPMTEKFQPKYTVCARCV